MNSSPIKQSTAVLPHLSPAIASLNVLQITLALILLLFVFFKLTKNMQVKSHCY